MVERTSFNISFYPFHCEEDQEETIIFVTKPATIFRDSCVVNVLESPRVPKSPRPRVPTSLHPHVDPRDPTSPTLPRVCTSHVPRPRPTFEQPVNRENAEASLTIPISADVKTKSAINGTRRVTKRTNVAATVNQVVEMVENLKHASHGDNRGSGGRKILDESHEHQGELKETYRVELN